MTSRVISCVLASALLGCGSSRRSPPHAHDAAVARPLPPDPPPAPVGDLPAECGVYKALADRLAKCDSLGPQRALLSKQFETSWQAWQTLPREKRDTIAIVAGCKAGAAALRVALASCDAH